MTIKEISTPSRNLIYLQIILIICLLLTSGAGYALSPPPGQATSTKQDTVTRGDFRKTITLTGYLVAREAERFKTPVTESWSIQVKWMAPEGSQINPGDAVIRLDTANLASEKENLEMSLQSKLEEKAQKEADIAQQEFELAVRLKQAEIDVKKARLDAAIPPDLVARYEYDEKQLDLKRKLQNLENVQVEKKVTLAGLTSEIEKLTIDIREARAKLKKNQDTLDSLTLKATTSGTLIYENIRWLRRKVQVGDTVFANSTLAHIPNPGSLQVDAWAGERDVQFLHESQKVELTLDAYAGRVFSGTIRKVLASAEKRENWGLGNYFLVQVNIDNPDTTIIKPGMSIRCVIQVAEYQDVLRIPLEMAYYDGQAFQVQPRGGKIVQLTPLASNDFFIAISPGSNPDIVEGTQLQMIQPGDIPPQTSHGEAK